MSSNYEAGQQPAPYNYENEKPFVDELLERIANAFLAGDLASSGPYMPAYEHIRDQQAGVQQAAPVEVRPQVQPTERPPSPTPRVNYRDLVRDPSGRVAFPLGFWQEPPLPNRDRQR